MTRNFRKFRQRFSPKLPTVDVINHLSGGESVTTYDGSDAWIASVNEPVPMILLTGGDLDGAELGATLAFPAMLKQGLTKWHVGFPSVTIDDHPVQVVEGTAAGGTSVKLFFDKDRSVASGDSFIDTKSWDTSLCMWIIPIIAPSPESRCPINGQRLGWTGNRPRNYPT